MPHHATLESSVESETGTNNAKIKSIRFLCGLFRPVLHYESLERIKSAALVVVYKSGSSLSSSALD